MQCLVMTDVCDVMSFLSMNTSSRTRSEPNGFTDLALIPARGRRCRHVGARSL